MPDSISFGGFFFPGLGKGQAEKEDFTGTEKSGKDNIILQQVLLLGAVASFVVFSVLLMYKVFACWTHVEGKRSRHISFEPVTTISSGKGKKGK